MEIRIWIVFFLLFRAQCDAKKAMRFYEIYVFDLRRSTYFIVPYFKDIPQNMMKHQSAESSIVPIAHWLFMVIYLNHVIELYTTAEQ